MNRIINILKGQIDEFRSRYDSNNTLLLLVLFSVALMVGINNFYLNIVVSLILSLIVLTLKPEKIFYTHIFLFFFESVTEIGFLGGSINRLVTVIGLIKILYYSFKGKTKTQKEYLFITLFLSIFLVYSIFVNISNIALLKENLVLYINIMFFVLYGNYFSCFSEQKKKLFVDELLYTIVLGVFASIIHGLTFFNFRFEHRAGFTNWRFNGTNDPNFLSYYVNLAIIIQMFRKNENVKIEKIKNAIINVFLILGLILAKSITGIFINIVSFIILFLVKNKDTIKKYISVHKLKVLITSFIIIITLGVGIFVVIKSNVNEVYTDSLGKEVAKNRIADVLLSIRRGDIDRLTSQKTMDWRLFLNDYGNSNVITKLLGKGMQPVFLYSSYWNKKTASHSTYIDFLCCYGIVGMLIIIYYIFRKTARNNILLSSIDNKIYKYIRIILLVYGIELGIYTNRIFLQFFLL